MKDKAFLDTNILIYLYSDEIDKKNKSIEWIKNYDCVISTQTLNELSNVLIRKFKLDAQTIIKIIIELASFCDIVNINLETITDALNLHEKFRFSYFDSLMLASAVKSNCQVFLTEDMNDGQDINGTKIVNIYKD